jgi:c-di-GMP-related signal transduction protein
LLHLEPQDALILMRAAVDQPVPQRLALLEGQMYEEIHSQTLARRCLEHYHASAIAGWPTDDVLHRVRGARVLHPTHEHVLRLMKAVDADQSLETFEEILSEDPLLAYRFMLYANSAALGARNPINSLRRALVMLGYGTLKEWLATQLTHASHDKDLQPIRLSTVMRAQMTSHLLDAGVSQELRSEVYLCGLFARLNDVLDEPLETTLTRLPLSERIPDAAIRGEGPYAPSLQLAFALERENGAATIRAVCEEHDISLEHVNRTLLRLACEWHNQRPHW